MAASLSKDEIEASCTAVVLSLGYSSLRERQKEVITNFVAGSDSSCDVIKGNCFIIAFH